MMLNGTGNEMTAFALQQSGDAENRQIIGFSSSAGKDEFTRFGPEKPGGPITVIIEQGTGAAAEMMNTRGISPNFLKKRLHRRADHRVERRGSVVVEVNRAHRRGN